jgi:FixJ family two-component response regulator
MPYVRNDLFDLAQCGRLPLDEHRFGRVKQRAFTKRVPKQLVVKDYLMRTTSPGRFTVFLVGDNQVTLEAMDHTLRVAGYETRTYRALQTFIVEHDPAAHGCTILDLSMRGLNGPNVKQDLVRAGVDRPIIFIGGDETSPAQALRACEADLINPATMAELLSAIRSAVKRDSDRLHCCAVAKRVETLTPRERKVLALVVRRMSNKNIAAGLGVREESIEVNRSRGMKKLGVKNLPELVRITSKVASDR